MKNYAIILASGTASRFSMGSFQLKQFAKVAGRTLLEHTIEIFEKTVEIDETIVVITPGYRTYVEEILLKNSYTKVVKILEGGDSRKKSSYIAINSITDTEANVVIHDCARPLLSQKIISDCIAALKHHEAIDVAFPSADTIIQINEQRYIESIPNRKMLMRGQTPQCFRLSLIRLAHELSRDDDDFTDDCGLIVKHRLARVYVVEGDRVNIKVTWPEDLFLVDKFFQIQSMRNLTDNQEHPSELAGKVIVLFGGSRGIGASIAKIHAELGGTICSYSTSDGCDITHYEQVENALRNAYAKYGRIDAVICTAGVLNLGKLAERKVEDIRREIEINYIGSIHVCKASIPYLRETHGSITLFTSSSYTRGRALYAPYSSTKAAIVNLVQAMAEELYSDNIRINAINPARTATSMRKQAFGNENPQTLLEPETVANVTLKTIMTDLTGQVIDVHNPDQL